ncbi:MAG: hypothetical protein AAF665_18845 [Pseudomonadota bacterium]
MTLSRILPEFGSKPAANAVSISEVSLEEQKLNSFEAGYQAGWDDSTAANRNAGDQVSADFAQNMAELTITYREAYDALLTDIRPFLTQMVDTVLPVVSHDTLVPRIVELIETEMSQAPIGRVLISASPDAHTHLNSMLANSYTGLDVELREDTTLSSGQVRLSFDNQREQELDTAALVAGIQKAVHGFVQGKPENAPDVNEGKETA